MEQTVEIPVEIRGEERLFTARVQAWQYGLRFFVDVDEVELTLERDDAGRISGNLAGRIYGQGPNKEVIGAIIGVLQQL